MESIDEVIKLNSKSEGAYMLLKSCVANKVAPHAIVEIKQKTIVGVKKVTKQLKHGDDLFYISNELEVYKGYVVSEIIAYEQKQRVSFTNNEVINVIIY